MLEAPSPLAARLRPPRWLDPRLITGVLLILLSIVLGAAVVSASDKSVRVWAVKDALPAGTAITGEDVTARRVRLFGRDLKLYVDADVAFPAGKVLLRDVGAGELLPAAAVGDLAGRKAGRIVSIPVERAHALGGEIRRGMQVDVVATFKATGGGVTTVAILRNVTVVGVSRSSSGFGASARDFGILVEVSPEQALAVAAAIESAAIDVFRVVPGVGGPGDIGPGPVWAGVSPTPTPRR